MSSPKRHVLISLLFILKCFSKSLVFTTLNLPPEVHVAAVAHTFFSRSTLRVFFSLENSVTESLAIFYFRICRFYCKKHYFNRISLFLSEEKMLCFFFVKGTNLRIISLMPFIPLQVKFEIMLVSPQARGLKEGKTEVCESIFTTGLAAVCVMTMS